MPRILAETRRTRGRSGRVTCLQSEGLLKHPPQNLVEILLRCRLIAHCHMLPTALNMRDRDDHSPGRGGFPLSRLAPDGRSWLESRRVSETRDRPAHPRLRIDQGRKRAGGSGRTAMADGHISGQSGSKDGSSDWNSTRKRRAGSSSGGVSNRTGNEEGKGNRRSSISLGFTHISG